MIYTNPIALRYCTHSKIIQMYIKNTTNTVFCSFLFVSVFPQAKIGISKAWGMYQLSNHTTSKISIIRFGWKFVWRCLKFEGLKVELGFPNMGDPLITRGGGC
jgi:hypothetical protein